VKQTYGVDLRGLARKAAGGGVTTSSRGRMPSLVERNQASSEAIALQMMDKEWAAGVHCFKCFGHFRCLGMVILSTNFIPALAEILYWNFRLPASHRALGDCDIIAVRLLILKCATHRAYGPVCPVCPGAHQLFTQLWA
jgi:hypothetical protein